jgi:hypothetical protein
MQGYQLERRPPLPAEAVRLGDRQRRHGEGAGREDQAPPWLGGDIPGPTYRFGALLRVPRITRLDGLIAAAVEALVPPGPDHRIRCAGMEPAQPPRVRNSSIHHGKRARLDGDLAHHAHLGAKPWRNPRPRGDAAPHVQQRIELDGGLARAEPCPGNERQTDADGRPTQRGGRRPQGGAQAARLVDQDLRQIRLNKPIACCAGIAQGAARDPIVEAGGGRASAERSQSGLEIARVFGQDPWAQAARRHGAWHEGPRGRSWPRYRHTRVLKPCRARRAIRCAKTTGPEHMAAPCLSTRRWLELLRRLPRVQPRAHFVTEPR